MRRYTERVDGAADITADDSATLEFERRCKTRLRVVLDDSGAAVGIQLPRGSVLRGGDLLRADDAHVIRVIAAPEAVSTVRADANGAVEGDAGAALARAAYHLGNRHLAVQIGDHWLRYLADPVIDDMLRAMNYRVTHERAPFEAEGGAYPGPRGPGHA